MSDDANTTRPPGWYPDASDGAVDRWWDGRDWTAHTRTKELPAPSAPRQRVTPTDSDWGRRPGRRVPVVATILIGVFAFVVGSVGGLVVGGVAGSVAAVGSRPHQATRVPATADSSEAEASDTPSAAFQYTADLFTIKLKVLSKECFGSAGCNLNVEPELSTADTSAIPDDASGELTYEITGGDDGPHIETIDLTGSKYSQERTVVGTSSASVKLKIKITDVETD